MHRRKAIRDAVTAALSAAPEILALSPAPGVQSSRVIPLDPAALPRVLVYLRGERVNGYLTTSPREYRVEAELVVEYVSRFLPGVGVGEDALDLAAEALETALDRMETSNLGELVREFEYLGTDVAIDERGELSTCSLVMRYQIELGRVVAPLLTDDFITAAIEHRVGDATADNPDDVVTLPIV